MSGFDEQEAQIIHEMQDAILDGMMKFKEYQDSKVQGLREQIDELQQFSDVSVVKSLTVENANLRSELNVLKRRYQMLETQSQRQRQQAAPAPVPVPEPEETVPEPAPVVKAKPTIKPKKRNPNPNPEPEPETEPEVEEQAPVPEPKVEEPEPAPEPEVAEPEEQAVPEPEVEEPAPEPRPQEPEPEEEEPEAEAEEEEEEEGLLLVNLLSGHYFLDTTTCELYDFIDDVTPGEIVGKLKTATIRKKTHYIDTKDDNIYLRCDDGDVGEHVGSRVNGKAVFKNKKR